jgi:hypothetical protein
MRCSKGNFGNERREMSRIVPGEQHSSKSDAGLEISWAREAGS